METLSLFAQHVIIGEGLLRVIDVSHDIDSTKRA